jgi:hypothetical protein
MLPLGIKAVAPQRGNQQTERVAAQYIFEHGGAGQDIWSPLEKIVYYAGGIAHYQPAGHVESLLRQLGDMPQGWVALYRGTIEEIAPGLGAALVREQSRGGLRLLHTFGSGRHPHLDLYQWQRP